MASQRRGRYRRPSPRKTLETLVQLPRRKPLNMDGYHNSPSGDRGVRDDRASFARDTAGAGEGQAY